MTFAPGFSFYELRTTEPASAAAFYTEVAALVLAAPPRGAERGPACFVDAHGRAWGCVTELPAAARALGAPPHWLGHVGVADVESTVSRLVAAGAQPIGAPRVDVDGRPVVALKDVGGAPFALAYARSEPGASPVAWQELHAPSVDAAAAFYAALGWSPATALVPGASYVAGGWGAAAARTSIVGSVTAESGIHPHWSFGFDVPSLARALDAVVRRGGRALVVGDHPSGARVAACEDAQGAAFTLREPLPPPSPAAPLPT